MQFLKATVQFDSPLLHMIFIAIEPWHPLLKTEQTAFILHCDPGGSHGR